MQFLQYMKNVISTFVKFHSIQVWEMKYLNSEKRVWEVQFFGIS